MMVHFKHIKFKLIISVILFLLLTTSCQTRGNTPDKVQKDTALMNAITENQSEVANRLIKGGANLNVINSDGFTPLLLALIYEQPENAKLIIETGISINTANNNGWTPLMFSLKYNQPVNAKLLIEKEVDIHRVNSNGWTAIRYAIQNQLFDIVRLLIDMGAELSISDMNNLAWEFISSPIDNEQNKMEAVIWAEKACTATNYSNALYLDTLAATYAATKQWELAVNFQKKAMQEYSENLQPAPTA